MAYSKSTDVSRLIKNLAFKKFEFETALQEAVDAVRAWEDVQKVLTLTEQVRTALEKSDSDLQQRCVCLPPSEQLGRMQESAGHSNQPGTVQIMTDSRGVVSVASLGNVQTVLRRKQGGNPRNNRKPAGNSKPNNSKPPKNDINSDRYVCKQAGEYVLFLRSGVSGGFVCIPGIPRGVKKSDVFDALSGFGTVLNVHFNPPETGRLATGFVEFESVGSARRVHGQSYVVNGCFVDFLPVNDGLQFREEEPGSRTNHYEQIFSSQDVRYQTE